MYISIRNIRRGTAKTDLLWCQLCRHWQHWRHWQWQQSRHRNIYRSSVDRGLSQCQLCCRWWHQRLFSWHPTMPTVAAKFEFLRKSIAFKAWTGYWTQKCLLKSLQRLKPVSKYLHTSLLKLSDTCIGECVRGVLPLSDNSLTISHIYLKSISMIYNRTVV